MTTIVQSSDSVAGAFNVTAGDEFIVRPGILLLNAGASTINLLQGTDPTALVNFGTIIGSNSGVTAVNLEADTSRVVNHGTISQVTADPSIITGVFTLAGGNSVGGIATLTSITNFGTIDSTGGFFDDFSADGPYNVVVENTGQIITSRIGQFLSPTSSQVDVSITNSGTMIGGQMGLNGSGESFLQNSGQFEMSFMNIGATGGATIFNSGTFVVSENGDRRTIDGSATSSEIEVANTGTIIANITLGSGEDIVGNSGTMLGDISLRGGDDGLTNRGDIFGEVNGGEGADAVFNYGVIEGVVDLGNDDDVFRNIGQGVSTGVIEGNAGIDVIIGGAEGDFILGGTQDDFLRGMGGADTIEGGADNDSILGDAGDDQLFGRTGTDTLRGGTGDDTIDGGDSSDELFGNQGNDTILGGAGSDTIRGGEGDDSIEGGTGDNNMNGGLGNDTVVGDIGNDLMRGNDGNDNLAGADGADTLLGGEGNDTITGGLGRDVMNGGLGADQFRFTGTAETGTGGARDLIQDFEVGTDLIVLSPLPGVLDFIGSAAFTGTGAEVRAVEISGGINTLVQIDGNGDGSVDAEILLSFATGVTADDFLL